MLSPGQSSFGRAVFTYRPTAGGISSLSSGQAKAACTPLLTAFLSRRDEGFGRAELCSRPGLGKEQAATHCRAGMALCRNWEKRRRMKEGKITYPNEGRKVSNLQFRQRQNFGELDLEDLLRNTEGVTCI